MDAVCYGCMVGFHEECIQAKPIENSNGLFACCCWTTEVKRQVMMGEIDPVAEGIIVRQPKAADAVRDQTSTGRKRAVVAMAEWNRGLDGSTCEWAYLRNAGGGAVPIVGCAGTIIREVKQTDEVKENESPRHIHHGPDKSTLNNSEENLHAICSSCHNRWHALNDPQYAKDRPDHGRPHLPLNGDVLPHDPDTRATDQEQELSNKFWSLSPSQRKVMPFRVMLESVRDNASIGGIAGSAPVSPVSGLDPLTAQPDGIGS